MITKRFFQLLITTLLLCPLTLQAQVVNQEEDDEDEVALSDTLDIDDDLPGLEEIVVIEMVVFIMAKPLVDDAPFVVD